MNNQDLAEDYLRWLEPQTRDTGHRQPPGEYWGLLRLMHAKPFDWTVPHDDNRVQDGLDLRSEYCHDHRLPLDALAYIGPCSFLEVLIGLSRRLHFIAGGNAGAPGWAAQLLFNLQLHRLRDPFTSRKARRANEIMDAVIWRQYEPNGEGGFFPLEHPREDQAQVELWYQMAAWVNELHPEPQY